MLKKSASLFALAICTSLASVRADVSWTAATTGTSWATGANWGNNVGPGTTDVASFASPGSATAPGDVTSVIDISRTIGGLYFNNTAGHYHTVDLGAHALTVAGNFNVNVDQNSSTTTTLRDGTLIFGGSFANINVGRGVAASAIGIADLTGLSSITGTLQSVEVGASSSGSATGTLLLSPSNSFTAQLIQVGASNNSSDTNGTLYLGLSNTVSAGEIDIGKDNSNGLVTITSGGSLTLGTASQQTLLEIANQTTNTNNLYTGTMNLGAAASVNLQLSTLIVADKAGGPGNCDGTLTGPNNGSVTIGTSTSPGNWYTGCAANGGSSSGIVNLSGMFSLSANLNTLSIGVATNGGTAQATVMLPAANTINANSIVVGSSGNQMNTLTLGHTNTILTNQLTIAQDYSNGAVILPAGGTLNLGSAAARTNLFIANATTNTSNTFSGALDASNGTINAWLGTVVLGTKNAQPGNEQATFSIGTSSANYVDATAITLGGYASVGTLNFGGGTLYAGSISAGTGTPVFNWTGGQVSVGTFGTPSIPFNLNNAGVGVLAPGTAALAVGTTTIYGNYNQSSAAATAMDIASTTADQINISGTATLAGTLSIKLVNGYMPAVGQSDVLETYAGHTGSYGFVLPPSLPTGVALKLDYSNPTQLTLSFVTPTTQNYVSSAAVGTFGSAANWDTQTTPGTNNSVSLMNTGSSTKTVNVSTSTSVDSVTIGGTSSAMDLDIAAGVELAVAGETTVATNGTLSVAIGGSVLSQDGIAGGGITVIESGGSVTAGFIRQTNLTVNGTATIAISNPHNAAATLSVIANLSIGGAGKIDLTNNDLDVQNSSLAAIENQIESGAITSGATTADTRHITALGVISNSADGVNPLYGSGTALGLFDGISPAATDVLVKYTYIGDANLDGKVDGSDYSRIDSGFLMHATGWYNGDFNYDGVINGSDYTLIDNAFNTQGAVLAAKISVPDAVDTAQIVGLSSVPEPAAAGLLAAVTAWSLTRRRRHIAELPNFPSFF